MRVVAAMERYGTVSTVEDSKPVPRRSGFSHVLTNRNQVERFNAEGGTPIAFVPRAPIPTHMVFEGAQNASMSVWRTSASGGFLSTPTTHADLVTIRFVSSGSIIRRDRRAEHSAGQGHAMMVTFDLMRSEEASEGFEALSATIAIPTLLAAQQALEGGIGGQLPAFMPVVDVLSLPMRALLHALRRMHDQMCVGVSDADLTFPMLAEIVSYQILTSWPHLHSTPVEFHPAEPRTLRRARDFIDENLSRKILLSDVAQAAGVGVRRLQSAFRTEVGKTPVRYITDRRLDRVRADLLAPREAGTPIRTIAERWGFTHMGDFGRRYRERFGELPSLTQLADR